MQPLVPVDQSLDGNYSRLEFAGSTTLKTVASKSTSGSCILLLVMCSVLFRIRESTIAFTFAALKMGR